MNQRHLSAKSILFTMILFDLSAFALLFFSLEMDLRILVIAAGAIGLLLFQYGALTAFFPGCDRMVLVIANFLVSVGLVVQTRIDPAIGLKQIVWIGIAMLAMIVTAVLIRRSDFWSRAKWLFILLSLGLLASAILFGNKQYGATNWVDIFGFTFQPSEFVKILLIFVLSALLTYRRTIGSWLVALGYVGACLLLLLVQKDLGAALLYAGTAVALVYVATGSKLLLGASLGAGAAGSVAAYHMFSHVRVRVALWQNPWAAYEGQGYQVVQGLIAIASGGLFGLGLTRGMPSAIPARHTDYIFAVICQEFGILFGLILIAFYLVFIIRGAIIAMDARSSFDALVAIGCVTMLSLQSFIIIGGVCKLIPLTGITMPFVSYGGSSVLSCFILLGILEGIAIKNADSDATEFEAYVNQYEEEEDWEDEEEDEDDAYDEEEEAFYEYDERYDEEDDE